MSSITLIIQPDKDNTRKKTTGKYLFSISIYIKIFNKKINKPNLAI